MDDEALDSTITEQLGKWSGSRDVELGGSVFFLVYDELRRRASSYLRKERDGHTLQKTGLVHEAYLKLADQKNVPGKAETISSLSLRL